MENSLDNLCFCVHGGAQIIANPQIRKLFSLPEIEEELSIAEQLSQLKLILTEKAWSKREWYKEGTHIGAQEATTLAKYNHYCSDQSPARAMMVGNSHHNVPFDILLKWRNRPNWVKRDLYFSDKNYGKAELHYFLGLFGLTITFNDTNETSWQDLHAKLDEAMEFAKEHSL